MCVCVCGQSAWYGTSNGQVYEPWKRYHNDEGNMLQVCPGTSVCQMNHPWGQYGSSSLGSLYGTYAVCWLSCQTHQCWEGVLRYCCRGPVGRGQHDKTASSVSVLPDHTDPFVPSQVPASWNRPGQTNLWHAYPKWHADRFPWHSAFSAIPAFLLPYHRQCIVKNMCVCVCVCICVCVYIYICVCVCICVCVYIYVCVYMCLCVYRVSQEEWTKLRESVPYVKLYRYNPKHPYPKLNGYGDNGQRILNFDSCYTFIYYQIHIKTGRNMWFLQC